MNVSSTRQISVRTHKKTMWNVGKAAAKQLVATSATAGQFQTHTEDYAFLIFNNFAGTDFHIQHFELRSGADHLSIFPAGTERSMAWSAPKIVVSKPNFPDRLCPNVAAPHVIEAKAI